MLDWLRQTMGPTRAYERLMTAGVLAALLALWIPVAPHLPHRAMLLGVGLVGVALIVVILWQIVQVLVVRAGDSQRLKIIRQNLDPEAFIPAFARAEEAAQRANAFTVVAWPFVFLLAALAGLAGALLVSYDAFAGAAGLPTWPAEPAAAHDMASPSSDIAPNDR
ncbi:MAG TPA: hypothetical protein VII73_11295 [Caulobacteraceae bacterium]